jgi:hypothetical protein
VEITDGVITGLSVPVLSDEDILSGSDDDDTFSRMLLSRIGTRPLLEDVAVTVDNAGTSPLTWIDRDHYIDLLTYILEDLVGTGADHLSIQTRDTGNTIVISIWGTIPHCEDSGKRRTWRFLQGLAERAGGRLTLGSQNTTLCYEFMAPSVDISG